MSWYRNLRMTPKLIGSFVVMAILAAVVAGAGYFGLQAQNTQVTHIKTVSYPNVAAIQNTLLDSADAIRYSRGAILASTTAQSASLADKALAADALAAKDWQTTLALPFDNAQEQALSNQTTPLLQQWIALDTQVAQLAAKNTTAGRYPGDWHLLRR